MGRRTNEPVCASRAATHRDPATREP